jgi:hypothetical protein
MDMQPVQNGSEHGFAFQECFAVAEPQQMKPLARQGGTAPQVELHRARFEVLTTVQFNDQLRPDASKIREETADRMLPPKLVPTESAIAQCVPNLAFSIGRGFAQLTRPHPNPLPRAGEGIR